MVFQPACDKFRRGLAAYIPYKRFYNTPSRIIIANTFLTPVFSYPCQFLMMQDDMANRLHAKLAEWVRPHANSPNIYHYTAPTQRGGLNVPLREPWKANIASVISAAPKPLQMHSNAVEKAQILRSHNNAKATKWYAELTENDAPDHGNQKQI